MPPENRTPFMSRDEIMERIRGSADRRVKLAVVDIDGVLRGIFERYDLDAYYTTCAADNRPSRRMIEKYVSKYGGQHEGLLRQHSSRPDGTVTDQHRFTILREEYEAATDGEETMAFDLEW